MPGLHSDVILKRLMALHPKVIDLSLDRMHSILEKLDHPEKRLPPVVHVAGTNGKGSLIAYLKAILEAAGYRVHVYTSPHLVKFAERIVLGGNIIPEAKLSDLLLACEEANGEDPITYFEITTAAAFKAFSENPADILLLETGLGGRLDATNMVEKPAATAITPVSHDHEQFLGSDLAGIAREKAGIIKKESPLILGPQTEVAKSAILQRAAELNVSTAVFGDDWSANRIDDEYWTFKGERYSGTYSLPSLNGPHQVPNAGTALAVLETLKDFPVTPANIEAGLKSVYWPARMQHLEHGNLAQRLPDNVDIWLDGGHNEAAAERIAECFLEWETKDDKPTYLICGMLETKDQLNYLRHMQKFAQKAIMVPVPGEPASTPEKKLAELGRAAGLDCEYAVSVEDAADNLIPYLMRKPCRLLIAGSLYLAGTVLRTNG
ncbi:bifunctional folylpolyglutamate synthase/dihydrofolate synthase [Sneathiella limimaris]|uniref:bifunctional folylpolyglutamate synthase/dihydrofolate synthase n=1 Tax=Sneathiella limimaris TaxID=1964213 RepID=UPI0019CFAF10|nr:folylpolyglutamate synthase/dihydrofolate synthase family protein [Sneathiella limimaris]